MRSGADSGILLGVAPQSAHSAIVGGSAGVQMSLQEMPHVDEIVELKWQSEDDGSGCN